jgi:hypothetical protein
MKMSIGEKMKKSAMVLAIVLMSITTLIMAVGCSTMNTVNAMPAEVDSQVKSMQPPPGKSLVYVVRPTSLGKPFGGKITANDEYVGTTQGHMYVYAILAPGEYKFKVTGHDNSADIVVKLEADKIYFIKQGLYPGFFYGFTKLELLDNDEGRKTLQECTLGDKLGRNIAH